MYCMLISCVFFRVNSPKLSLAIASTFLTQGETCCGHILGSTDIFLHIFL